MRDLLRDLRSIVEHERAVYGRVLPLDDPDEPSRAVQTASSDASADEPPEAAASSEDDAPEAPPPGDRAAETSPSADAGRSPASSSSSSTPDDSAPDPMPNKDLFGNRTRPPEEDPTLPPWKRVDALVPDDAPYKNAETLAEVEQYLADTVLVPIDEDRENPVFGVGDPDADLVIIGEAPGRDEDKEGEPFVGRAGTLLDKILDAINFEREEVYITNILKSRPPRNRDPHQEEVEAHLPILYKQLALIRPKIILAVGKVAGNTLLDRSSSLSNLRDKEHDFYGTPLMVTYHPAALLRNSQWKRPTWEDVKLLRTRYDELTGEDD
jgi:DNA polymerase